MRQRVARVAVMAVLVALVLLAVPLAVAIRASFFADERGELERDALAAAVRVGPGFAAGDPVELPPGQSDGRLGVYDMTSRLRTGSGPAVADAATRHAASSGTVTERTGHDIVVAVPVSSGERVIGVVRTSTGVQTVRNRVLLAWAVLLGAALFSLGVAVLVARRQARALTAPLESLSRTSRAVAEGDLTARAAPCGIAEIDQVADTQNAMVRRLAQRLQHERHFTANASHQLRTPLTGLQLGLESALSAPDAGLRRALAEALEQTRHLDDTIDEVLRLAKAEPAAAARESAGPAAELLDAAERRWHGALARDGRRLDIGHDPGTAGLPLPRRTTAQILDVLLDNARKHGRGTVAVRLRDLGGTLALDVTDEGTVALPPRALFDRGCTTGTGQGIGLALAAELAEAAGGRLGLAAASPARFTLLLPSEDAPRPA
ncbi:sensor histidine kinase [Streptomyces sp. CBMA29]|uniref:sensor histidine kinase n=1 Tax=Streptomyces sp. CBMA29 TaxID=1896314 RepID=UPI0016618A1F|nr:HAMP domain-containing sensor histidine kinase [Streptomyces sp. CBMA29]MBD0737214.1 two-component sensor histidine kinase [Streptomyces sp. CBMA29]